MDKKQFERIITDLTEDWLYDSIEPVRGIGRVNGKPVESRRRTYHDGEEREPNETGSIQIVKWMPRTSVCLKCDRRVENHNEHIDLQKRKIKCGECGIKYPLDSLNPFK